MILRGTVLVAPGDSHLLVGPDMRISLDASPPVRGNRPSIDVTMQSVAGVYRRRASGVLLTGAGEDGGSGLAAIQAGGGKTFAQEPASCVVPAMTQRAINKGVVDHVGTPEALGLQLKVLTS
jgi:two-component system chemotaxis response regulator CheB